MQSKLLLGSIRHSQNTPVKFGGQEQVKLSTPSMQVPPLEHLIMFFLLIFNIRLTISWHTWDLAHIRHIVTGTIRHENLEHSNRQAVHLPVDIMHHFCMDLFRTF